MPDIEKTVDETMSVAPPGHGERPNQGDAGSDASIEERLKRNPSNVEAQLDRGSDESMDASDPPASALPGHGHEPVASSGFNEAAERARQEDS